MLGKFKWLLIFYQHSLGKFKKVDGMNPALFKTYTENESCYLIPIKLLRNLKRYPDYITGIYVVSRVLCRLIIFLSIFLFNIHLRCGCPLLDNLFRSRQLWQPLLRPKLDQKVKIMRRKVDSSWCPGSKEIPIYKAKEWGKTKLISIHWTLIYDPQGNNFNKFKNHRTPTSLQGEIMMNKKKELTYPQGDYGHKESRPVKSSKRLHGRL